MGNHRIVGIAVLAIAAFFAIGLWWIDSQSGYSGVSNRTLPVIVSAGLALCGVLLMLRPGAVLLTSDLQSTDEADQAATVPADLSRFAWLMAGLVLTILLIGLIGFALAGVLLMVCVARGYGSTRPLRDALVALALTLMLWLLFTKFLAINLPLLPVLGL